jgi:hypothetical protein
MALIKRNGKFVKLTRQELVDMERSAASLVLDLKSQLEELESDPEEREMYLELDDELMDAEMHLECVRDDIRYMDEEEEEIDD